MISVKEFIESFLFLLLAQEVPDIWRNLDHFDFLTLVEIDDNLGASIGFITFRHEVLHRVGLSWT
jgi:hypothetical protein